MSEDVNGVKAQSFSVRNFSEIASAFGDLVKRIEKRKKDGNSEHFGQIILRIRLRFLVKKWNVSENVDEVEAHSFSVGSFSGIASAFGD